MFEFLLADKPLQILLGLIAVAFLMLGYLNQRQIKDYKLFNENLLPLGEENVTVDSTEN